MESTDKNESPFMEEKNIDKPWTRRLSSTFFSTSKQLAMDEVIATSRGMQLLKSPPVSPKIMMTRSVLMPHTTEDIIETLDPRFYTSDFDTIGNIFEMLPTDSSKINDFLQTEICAVDIVKDEIVSLLAHDVRTNYNSFIQGMKFVQDVDVDLVRAQIHMKNGRRLLQSAKSDLIHSSLEVVKIKRNRDRVETIIDLGTEILELFAKEKEMNQALQQQEFTKALDICVALREELTKSQYHEVIVLKKLLSRIHHFLPELRQQFDISLREVAEDFNSIRYKELLQAYITLSDHSKHLGLEFTAIDLHEVLSSIPEMVVRCIDTMTKKILDQTQTIPTLQAIASSTSGSKEVQDDNETRLSVSSNIATPVETVHYVSNCYKRLTDLLHTYYLLVQWHRDPFNPKNDNLKYLHRCGIDADDDDDDTDNENYDFTPSSLLTRLNLVSKSNQEKKVSTSTSRRSSKSNENGQQLEYSQDLREIGMTLLRYRKIVWENMQQALTDMIDRLDITAAYKVEQIVALSIATNEFVEIGEEFIGATSNRLNSIIRIKCEQYINAMHEDNLELMRVHLEMENWKLVPIPSTAQTLLGLIEARSGYHFDVQKKHDNGDKVPSVSSPIYERRIFPTFCDLGNPFNKGGEAYLSKFAKTSQDLHNKQSNATEELVYPITNPKQLIDFEVLQLRNLTFNASTVAGFARFCGVYLGLMENLPHVSWEIYQLLLRIFDINIYAVTTIFIEPSIFKRLFQAHLGPRIRQWHSLRNRLFRIAQDVDSTSSHAVLLNCSAIVNASGDEKNSGRCVERTVILPQTFRTFITTNQSMGRKALYKLSEKCVAIEGLMTQHKILEQIYPYVKSLLGQRYHCLLTETNEQNQTVMNELNTFYYYAIAYELLAIEEIEKDIQMVSWADIQYARKKSAPSDFIVEMVRRCGLIWGEMALTFDSQCLSPSIRDKIFTGLVNVCMATLLMGFATIPNCSIQGRSQMILDVHALHNGLEIINHFSSSKVPMGRDYVNTYLHAFFLDENEVLDWITKHKEEYDTILLVQLIKFGVGSSLSKAKLSDLVYKVESLLPARPF